NHVCDPQLFNYGGLRDHCANFSYTFKGGHSTLTQNVKVIVEEQVAAIENGLSMQIDISRSMASIQQM
ncbi:hypothetical protein, partial [Paenibacillus koleovorans]|uniref:hypothetical protein n=1 Tax=Paenibacillus koleovorans TaxID=121608 RepID=UPI001C3F7B75